ncbi:hypothetical protein SDC9_99545 [bioreactor metagenome]|uniref:Uncharacterized protein n=1 Tax=bioreactor metagenome TaxID=1076179 RepID=A0A645AHU3_9ZZZZ
MQQIAVTGDDLDAKTFFDCLGGNSAQYVIGFKAFFFQTGEVKSVHHLANAFDLCPQVIWHLGAGGFVTIKEFIAEGLAGIKGHSQVLWFFLFQ